MVVLPLPGGPQRITDIGLRTAHQLAQRRARSEQVLLADELVEGGRAHPDRQRASRHRAR